MNILVGVVSVCLHQALDALDRALQQNTNDLTVRAELYFSKGNQLREMNQLDQAFEVLLSIYFYPLLTLPPSILQNFIFSAQRDTFFLFTIQ